MSRTTEFTGTPAEVETMMRCFFDSQREYIRGRDEGYLDTFERTVWHFTVEPLDMVARERARDTLKADVARMDAERDVARELRTED